MSVPESLYTPLLHKFYIVLIPKFTYAPTIKGKSCQYEHYSVKGTFDPLDVFMAPDLIPKSTYWPGITGEA